jgi:hypothetical protein
VPVPVASGPAFATDDRTALADGDDFDDLEFDTPRWVGLTTLAGAGIIGVVALQVLMAIVEGITVKEGQRFGVPDDLLHRIGYPFGSLGSTAMFFLCWPSSSWLCPRSSARRSPTASTPSPARP